MAEIILDNNIVIGDYNKPYMVAEVNSSHNGDLGLAKEMISVASSIGVDCVKFQSFSPNSLYAQEFYDINPIQKRIIDKFSLSSNELLELAEYCDNNNISFSSTPYSNYEVDLLVECNVPFIKISSMDINNLLFLEYVSKKNKPIVLSTGMADVQEIKTAVNLIHRYNDRLIVLHCVSIYPTKITDINTRNILMLREEIPSCPIGFSDHTLSSEASIVSVGFGACLIEKHFTLNNSRIGLDNNMAMEPNDFKNLICSCHNAYLSLGVKERILSSDDIIQKNKMRRSIIVNKDLCKGDIISIDNIDFKRPGNGIQLDMLYKVLGKKLKVDIKSGYLLDWSHLEL